MNAAGGAPNLGELKAQRCRAWHCLAAILADARRGETVKAVVVRKSGAVLSEAELIEWCRAQMAAYKVPHLVAFVDQLPKSATGKVHWRQLQEAAV